MKRHDVWNNAVSPSSPLSAQGDTLLGEYHRSVNDNNNEDKTLSLALSLPSWQHWWHPCRHMAFSMSTLLASSRPVLAELVGLSWQCFHQNVDGEVLGGVIVNTDNPTGGCRWQSQKNSAHLFERIRTNIQIIDSYAKKMSAKWAHFCSFCACQKAKDKLARAEHTKLQLGLRHPCKPVGFLRRARLHQCTCFNLKSL